MHWSRLDYTAVIIGAVFAIVLFPIFFKGFEGFWESLTDFEGLKRVSIGHCKIFFWLLLTIGGAYSARYNLPRWFPHFFK